MNWEGDEIQDKSRNRICWEFRLQSQENTL